MAGGQTITYTLKPANAAGRPPLHDAWQLDCLPNGLTFAAYGALPGGVSTSPRWPVTAPTAARPTTPCWPGTSATWPAAAR